MKIVYVVQEENGDIYSICSSYDAAERDMKVFLNELFVKRKIDSDDLVLCLDQLEHDGGVDGIAYIETWGVRD